MFVACANLLLLHVVHKKANTVQWSTSIFSVAVKKRVTNTRVFLSLSLSLSLNDTWARLMLWQLPLTTLPKLQTLLIYWAYFAAAILESMFLLSCLKRTCLSVRKLCVYRNVWHVQSYMYAEVIWNIRIVFDWISLMEQNNDFIWFQKHLQCWLTAHLL